MGWYGFSNTGACCCNAGQTGNACTLIDDDFDRADDTDMGAGVWDEAVPGAEISGNVALVNVNGAQIIATNANPDGPYTHISVDVKLISGSSTARVFLGWATTASYLYATVSNTAIVVGMNGGASTSTPVTITPGSTYTLTLCFTGELLIGNINGKQAVVDGVSAAGTRHGFGCGVASVTFDNFVARKISAACAECKSTVECGNCCSGGAPSTLVLDATGLSGTNDECDNCADIATEYSVPYVGIANFSECFYRYRETFCSWPCGVVFGGCGGTFILRVEIYVTAACAVRVVFLMGGIGGAAECPCDLYIATATYQSPINTWTGACTGPLVINRTSQSIPPADPNPRAGPACVMTFPDQVTLSA